MASILIVDAARDVTQAVSRSLFSAGYEIFAAYDGAQALRRLQESPVDLAIIELILPQMDGIELCRKIRGDPVLGQTRILVLTARHDISNKVGAFHIGVDDYLTKPFEMVELECRVEALLRRSLDSSSHHPVRFLSLKVDGVSLEMDTATFRVYVDGRKVHLTPTEFDLLYCLMEHVGAVVPHDSLLLDVWGYKSGTGDPELVRAHIKNLRSKLAQSSRKKREIIQTSLRRGYMISTETSR
ncbi:MAG: response regulator transcription factor [Dehalococcoidia bacterium]